MNNLSCPFCGDKEPDFDSDNYGSMYICCSHCEAKSEAGINEEDCWKNWNTRAVTGNIESYRQGFNDAKLLIIGGIERLKVNLNAESFTDEI